MARLGDEDASVRLGLRLDSFDVEVRVPAIQDVMYVGDLRYASHFRGLIVDRRDAIVISLPHDPVVAARVCDIAIQALAALGIEVSYAASPTRRFSEYEVEEMTRMLNAYLKK